MNTNDTDNEILRRSRSPFVKTRAIRGSRNSVGLGSLVIRGFLGKKGIIQLDRKSVV
jgi:hypothetical protein